MLNRTLPARHSLTVLGVVLALCVGALLYSRQAQARRQQQLPASFFKSYATAQELFRERNARYATSFEDMRSLDAHWASPIYRMYNGYGYESVSPTADPAFAWAARATPAVATWPHFYCDQTRVVRFEDGKLAGPSSPVWKPGE